jgi:hypothetical protein
VQLKQIVLSRAAGLSRDIRAKDLGVRKIQTFQEGIIKPAKVRKPGKPYDFKKQLFQSKTYLDPKAFTARYNLFQKKNPPGWRGGLICEKRCFG